MTSIRKVEELSMNALPALQTHLFDGWVLRFSEGYTKRANSINPLYFSKEDLEGKIKKCEWLYEREGLDVVYKLTSQSQPDDLDNILETHGYSYEGVTSVQLLELESLEVPEEDILTVDTSLHEEWFVNFCSMNNVKKTDRSVLKKMLQSLMPKACFVMMYDNSRQVTACGLGVLEDRNIGLFDIVTAEPFRNQGYGRQLILNILQWGKEHGAERAYLQVVFNNIAARHLYTQLGFKEIYTYWYRIKRQMEILS